MSVGRDLYRVGLIAAIPLLIAEIAIVREQKHSDADGLEPFDASDVLEAHGVVLEHIGDAAS